MIDSDIELVIFDADGTLRYVTVPGQHYPLRPEQWRLIPTVRETLASLPAQRLKFGIASNQHGVALGLLTRADAEAMLVDTWHSAFGPDGPQALVEMCVCLPDASCPRRKPEPGMLQSLLRRHSVSAARALYVGDLRIDQLAAANANVRFRWAHDFFARRPGAR
ncbi:MAG TPA: HAD-IIIA family hydrolase [Polyangiaceae bacterium]|nr:HAD-IIIA family hydrolase [Polyangiaceae bacterium]